MTISAPKTRRLPQPLRPSSLLPLPFKKPTPERGATGFYAWIDDYITFDQNRAGGSQLSQVIFTNTDLVTLAGGELFAEVDLTDNLTPFLTVNYSQALKDQLSVITKREGR